MLSVTFTKNESSFVFVFNTKIMPMLLTKIVLTDLAVYLYKTDTVRYVPISIISLYSD